MESKSADNTTLEKREGTVLRLSLMRYLQSMGGLTICWSESGAVGNLR